MSVSIRTAALALLIVVAVAATGRGDDRPTDLLPIGPISQLRIESFRNYGGYNYYGNAVVITPDGKSVMSNQGNQVYVYDITKAENPNQPRQPRYITLDNQGYAQALTMMSDGKTLVTVSQQPYGFDSPVRFLDLGSGKELRTIDNDQPFISLAASPDGKRLAFASQQQQRIEIWDAETGDEIRIFQGNEPNQFYRLLCFSPDGRMLATVGMGGTVQLWEIATGKERAKIHLEIEGGNRNFNERIFRGKGGLGFDPNQGNTITSIAFSRDGNLLAIGGFDSSIHLWNVLTGQELAPLSGHAGPVIAMTFLANGKEIVSFDNTGLKMVWSVARISKPTPTKLLPLPDEEFADLWNDLSDADTFRTYRAIRYLSADPKRAIALFEKNVKPVPPGDEARITQLIADLQNINGGTRRKAMTELTTHGEAALGALTQLPPEQQNHQTVRAMIGKLSNKQPPADRMRTIKAVQILGQLGTDEAKQMLEKVAKGATGVRLTLEAKAALEKFGKTGEKSGIAEGKPDELWTDLGSDDPEKAFRAVRGMIAASKDTLPFLRENVKPMAEVDEKAIEKFVADLDGMDFESREKATQELEKLAELAQPALKKYLAGQPGLEGRKRAERLMEKLSQTNTPATPTLRTMRALEAVERMDTPAAKELLESLSKGASNSWLTREAKAVLDRRNGKTATP
jgi:WD40 repeat protein